MFVTIEKPKDKDEVQNYIGIVLSLVDRSDEVVVGTIERFVKNPTCVHLFHAV